MSDFEYEDDLDILTSLLDDEDDEEEKLRKKVKSASPSSSQFEKQYVNKPPKNAKPASQSLKTSEENKVASKDLSTSGQYEQKNDNEISPDFDDEDDIEDLAALLEAEEAMETDITAQQDTPSTSQISGSPTRSSLTEIKPVPSAEENGTPQRSDGTPRNDAGTPQRSDEEMSKEELLEELRQMKAAMAQIKKTKESPTEPESKQPTQKKKEHSSPPREMFSDALTPKLEPKKSKSTKSKSSSSSDEGSQSKKKYKMDGAAATELFHNSQYANDLGLESSDDSEDEEEDKKPMVELFSKNKKRVAHTPSNQPIKSKKDSPYQCKKCDKCFSDYNSYKMHEFQHRKNPSNDCRVCRKSFASGEELVTHMRTHKNNGKSAKSSSEKNNSTPARFSSEKNNDKFARSSSMKCDTPTRASNSEEISNRCRLCSKNFVSRHGLTTHLTNDHGEAGEKELVKLRKITMAALSETPSSSNASSYKQGYGMKYSSEKKQGSKLLGDSKRLMGDDGQMFETNKQSQIRIINPVISSASLNDKMSGRKFLRLPVISKSLGLGGDVEGDWATIAVLVSKVPPKTSTKGKVFSIWKLNDLNHLKSTVALFLFGKVHDEHWKTVEGSVIGILNANIMPNRDNSQYDDLSMTIDHPQKMMVLGKSKDFGYCKAKKKNGNPCTMIVNKAVCEHCEFHVASEYKKISGKRTDLQASYSGQAPKKYNAMHQATKNVFYGGNSYNADKPKVKAKPQKKGAIGSSLGSAKGVDKLLEDTRKDVILMHGKGKNEQDTMVQLSGASENFKGLLSQPTPGSQNLMRHMVAIETKEKAHVQGMSARELLKMKKQEEVDRRARQNQRKPATMSRAPRIQQDDDFAFSSENSRPRTSSGSSGKGSRMEELARRKAEAMKRRAAAKLGGALTKQDPNRVGGRISCDKTKEAVKKRVDKDVKDRSGDSSFENEEESEPEPQRKKRKIFLDDGETMSEERLKDILNAKSKNADLLEEIEAKWQDDYFTQLEKKEKLETKMSEVMEKKCRVVSCRKCNYTWFVASKYCRDQGHQPKYHEAVQRYYNCKNCRCRSITFDKMPTKPCRSCGSVNYERTSMLRERKGPKLESEKLLIRGEERKYVSSL